MARDDWYRNTTWSPEIEAAFFAKLHRAREKAQYLRIQAIYLTDNNRPAEALNLYEQYFATGDNREHAMAYADKAKAHLLLGELEAAISCYERALEVERERPNRLTRSSLDFPYLIATRRIRDLYARALEVLGTTRLGLVFPIDRYIANGVRALVLQEQGRGSEARPFAEAALTASTETHSGFRYHQHLGLVPSSDDEFGDRLRAIVATVN